MNMTPHAKRAGLETLAAVLRRRHPGFDIVVEVEGDNGVSHPRTRQVGRRLATPQDAEAVLERVGVAPPASRTTNNNSVNEAGEHFPTVTLGEG
jgi:hypothetical protein